MRYATPDIPVDTRIQHTSNQPIVAPTNSQNTRRDRLAPQLQATAQDPLDVIDLTPESIARQQKRDPQCKQILNYLQYGHLPANNAQGRVVLLRQEDYVVIKDLFVPHIHIHWEES